MAYTSFLLKSTFICLEHSLFFLPISGWCPSSTFGGMGQCLNGDSNGPYASNSGSGCSALWTTSFATCSATDPSGPPDIVDGEGDGDAAEGGGSVINGDSFTPRSGTGSYNTKSKAAFPLLIILLAFTITGIIFMSGCIRRFTPVPGSRAGGSNWLTPYALNSTYRWILLACLFVGFVLLITAAGVDTWSFYENDGITMIFGVVGIKVKAAGFGEKTLTYSCSSGSNMSTDDILFCVSFVGGAVLTLIYESLALLFALLAGCFIFHAMRTGSWSSRIYCFAGIASVCAVATLLNWALTTHLCLAGMSDSSDGGFAIEFGASWGLTWPTIFFFFCATLFFRTAVEFIPSPSTGSTSGGSDSSYATEMQPNPAVAGVSAEGFVAKPAETTSGFAQI